MRTISLVTGVGMRLSLLAAPAWADISEFPLTGPNSGDPTYMTVGPDGNIWFTEGNHFSTTRGSKIGRISPQDPGDGSTIAEFELTSPNSYPFHLTVGPDNNLWFTEYNVNRIGRITVEGQITEFELPTPNSGPTDITLGPDGNLWITENLGRIGVMTPDGEILHEFPIPTPNSQLEEITVGPDGNLWFTECLGNKIGRITVDGNLTEFALPRGDSYPWGLTVGPDRNLWFNILGSPNGIGRITPDGVVTEFDLSNNHDGLDIKAGPDGNLWFPEWAGAITRSSSTRGKNTKRLSARPSDCRRHGLLTILPRRIISESWRKAMPWRTY
jgi:streptogramin lyase